MPYSEHLKAVVEQHGDDQVGGGHHDEVGFHSDVGHHKHGDTDTAVTEDGPQYFDWNDMGRHSAIFSKIISVCRRIFEINATRNLPSNVVLTTERPFPLQLSLCQRHNNPNNIMSRLLTSSGPFLFPCTIEYSLICAAVLFVMWKHIDEEHDYYVEQKRRRKISRVRG